MDQCCFWHSRVQYLVREQEEQRSRGMEVFPQFPQKSSAIIESGSEV